MERKYFSDAWKVYSKMVIRRNVSYCIRHVDDDIIVLLNNDTVVSPGWLQPLVEVLDQDERAAAVQPKLRSWFQKERFDYAGGAGGEIDRWGYPFCWGRMFTTREEDMGQYDEPRNVFWSSGSASAWKRSAIMEAGLLDEDFFAHMEEIDLCWRLHLMGYDVRYQPGPEVYHCSGATLGEETFRKKFLNHRNSWLVLIKNYRWANVLKTLPLRLILDLITIPYALVIWGDIKRVFAIIGSWISVLAGLPQWLQSRREVQRLRKVSDDDIMKKLYPRSVAWQYFVRRIRSTEGLPW
jgi:GT2 family glycosyltransferase